MNGQKAKTPQQNVCRNPWQRKLTRELLVAGKAPQNKWVKVGGENPVSVQSMTTTRTHDALATLSQIRELAAAGCNIIRVACPTDKDAEALAQICELSPIPVIVDVHFRSSFVFAAIEAGAGAVRVNPGNIKNLQTELPKIVAMCREYSVGVDGKTYPIPLRIGVNAGSLSPDLLAKYNGKATPEALVESARREAAEFENLGFKDYAISVKHHDPVVTIKTYELLSEKLDCPLHLGVTEAGPEFQGTIKSAVAFGALLSRGIGDTIRVSLSADPIREVEVGREILMSSGLMKRKLEIISCPTCGRKEADVIELAAKVEAALKARPELNKKPLRVAVMGCVVNGPGEAREADIGIASGREHSELFIKGEVVERVPTENAVKVLLEKIEELLRD